MGFYKLLESSIQYLSEAVARIFGPNDDIYPAIGVQPFSGDPFEQKEAFW